MVVTIIFLPFVIALRRSPACSAHSTVFDTEEGVEGVAALVKAYIDKGGHQLQLNSINRERLLDAQAHPENYGSLIVRIWGWSAYFVELEKKYQDHLIARQEFTNY